MDFELASKSRPNTGEFIEVAQTVRFEDAAELKFAIGCLDAVRLFIALDPPERMDQEVLDSMAEDCKNGSAQLRALLGIGQEFNQRMLSQATSGSTRFTSRKEVTANAVRIAVDLVRKNPNVRGHFPVQESDLLTVFAPDPEV